MTKGLQFDDFCETPKIRSVQTLIQESDEKELEMAYLLQYLAKDGQNSTHWLHLPLLFRKLQRIARTRYCEHTDQHLDETSTSLSLVVDSSWTYDYVTRSISRESVNNTQRFLNTLGDKSSIWILLDNTKVCKFIIGQPLLLYAMISPKDQDLVPFTKCLHCVMNMADDSYVNRPTVETDGQGNANCEMILLASSLSSVVISWREIEIQNYWSRTNVDEDLDLTDDSCST